MSEHHCDPECASHDFTGCHKRVASLGTVQYICTHVVWVGSASYSGLQVRGCHGSGLLETGAIT